MQRNFLAGGNACGEQRFGVNWLALISGGKEELMSGGVVLEYFIDGLNKRSKVRGSNPKIFINS